MLLYDRGVYIGTFRSFETEETAESPFSFRISWSFKVRETILKIPGALTPQGPAPAFQAQNLMRSDSRTATEAREEVEVSGGPNPWHISSDADVAAVTPRLQAEITAARLAEAAEAPVPPESIPQEL
jgi:hypothetical protein